MKTRFTPFGLLALSLSVAALRQPHIAVGALLSLRCSLYTRSSAFALSAVDTRA